MKRASSRSAAVLTLVTADLPNALTRRVTEGDAGPEAPYRGSEARGRRIALVLSRRLSP